MLLWIYDNKQEVNPKKSRKKLISESMRRLTRNPKDAKALMTLGNLYYDEKAWEKSFSFLDVLVQNSTSATGFSAVDILLKHGVCALHLNQLNVAYKSLSAAYAISPSSIDVNYFLGKILFELEIYNKAIRHLHRAAAERKHDGDLLRCLGIAYYNCSKQNDALKYLEEAILFFPGNAEILYMLAESYRSSGNTEKAIESYLLLAFDAQYGPESCLVAGALSESLRDVDKAIEIYKIGLQHKRLTQENCSQLYYKLGKALISKENIFEALDVFQKLESMYPGYNDVPALITKYLEVAQNHNFHVYLLGDKQQFETLCSHIISALFPDFQTEINVLPGNHEVVDIAARLRQKEETLVMFRCLRTENMVGELPVREFYGKVRDSKVSQGIFITAGDFQKTAIAFALVRPVKLVNKAKLVRILKKLKPVLKEIPQQDAEKPETEQGT